MKFKIGDRVIFSFRGDEIPCIVIGEKEYKWRSLSNPIIATVDESIITYMNSIKSPIDPTKTAYVCQGDYLTRDKQYYREERLKQILR